MQPGWIEGDQMLGNGEGHGLGIRSKVSGGNGGLGPEGHKRLHEVEVTNQMKEIVDWLRKLEQSAHDLYSRSSEFFANDKELSAFLQVLAEDESWHFHLMDLASDFLTKSETVHVSVINLDQSTIDHVENPLRKAHELLSRQALSQTQILETIAKTEASEWNPIFLYAINSLKDCVKLFQHIASVMQAHQDRIDQFLCGHPLWQAHSVDIRQLSKIWEPKFLIVDDDESLRFLLSDLLRNRGVVESAQDGRDGLGKVRKQFFNVIVTDISMPAMNGPDFYREAVKEDARIGGNFLFCSGEITADRERFLVENDLPYLRKPFSVNEFMKLIEQVLQQSNLPPKNRSRF
jgi:CheY-like chemotaxis protein